MALYHFSVKIGKRSSGRSSVAAAAYYSRKKLKDRRQNLTFNYSKIKGNLVYSAIITPQNAPDWTKDREQLWNKVEAKENRKDSQLFRKIGVALPKELSLKQQINLICDFTKESFVNKGMIADINIHHKKDNPYAQIMLTMRALENNGFGLKIREWNHKESLLKWREDWANIQNQHLVRVGHYITVDHRSHKDKLKKTERYQKVLQIARKKGNAIIQNPKIALEELCYHNAIFKHDDIIRSANLHSANIEQFTKVCSAILQSSECVCIGKNNEGERVYTTRKIILSNIENAQSKSIDLYRQSNHDGQKWVKTNKRHKNFIGFSENTNRHCFSHILIKKLPPFISHKKRLFRRKRRP